MKYNGTQEHSLSSNNNDKQLVGALDVGSSGSLEGIIFLNTKVTIALEKQFPSRNSFIVRSGFSNIQTRLMIKKSPCVCTFVRLKM